MFYIAHTMYSVSDVTRLPLIITALFVTIQTKVLRENYCISWGKLDFENKSSEDHIFWDFNNSST